MPAEREWPPFEWQGAALRITQLELRDQLHRSLIAALLRVAGGSVSIPRAYAPDPKKDGAAQFEVVLASPDADACIVRFASSPEPEGG